MKVNNILDRREGIRRRWGKWNEHARVLLIAPQLEVKRWFNSA